MNIALMTMGGTLDKDYFDALSEYQVVDSIMLDEVLRLGVPVQASVTSICKKDSLELDLNDRERLLEAIEASEASHILVSHGTDTLVETAQFLESRTAKTVVLFGAMRPARFKDSDAIFNMGFALGVLRTSSPGVYVAMSAQVFRPSEVAKNRQGGVFQPV